MSTKKKKRFSKKKVIKEEIVKAKPKRRLIPFTAGRLPSVSKAMPPAASAIPLVSKEIPLVSGPIPLVSATPNITLPRHWKIMPSRKWGVSKIPGMKRRKVKRPKDIGLFKALGETLVSPVLGPAKMVEGIASALKAQAEEEKQEKKEV